MNEIAADPAGPNERSVAGRWQWIDRTSPCHRLFGNTEAHESCELRRLVGPWWDRRRLAELRQRLALIRFIDHASVMPVVEASLDGSPPTLVMAVATDWNPLVDRFAFRWEHLHPADRMSIASQLSGVMAEAHRVGLVLGQLSDDELILFREPKGWRLWVDLTLTRRTDPSPTVEADLIELKRRMTEWFGAESLASFLFATTNPPTADQWCEELSRRMTGTLEPRNVGTRERPLEESSSADAATSELDVADAGFIVPQEHPDVPKTLGRFEIVERIGAGAMGTVYRGIDQADGSIVAVKVLKSAGGNLSQAVRRFRKEARLLRDVQNDLVTRLIEVGEDAGRHYLVMEFIDGINLRQWLTRHSPLDETTALTLAADLARSMVDAHSQQIVHRDIKPENVLLAIDETSDRTGDSILDLPLSSFRLKMTDFGIARHVHQSSSMEVTRAGTVLGTPRYMSPEQCRGSDSVGPASDVYSIGVMLYEFLAGELPFQAADFVQLAHKHCYDTPPPLQKRNAAISDATVHLVEQSMAKSVEGRLADAGQLLTLILRQLRGEASAFELHPRTPPARGDGKINVWDQTRVWEMKSSPEELWPLVSNTERLNRAIGLPSVTYRTEKDPKLGLRKFGSFQISGMNVSWEEHPFEWIEGSRMGILREFDSGPYSWFLSVVTLEAGVDGGTRLSHRLRLLPRNWLGRVLVKVEMERKGFRGLDRVYRRMDQTLADRRKHGGPQGEPNVDPFEVVAPLSGPTLQRLKERCEAMRRAGADERATRFIAAVIETQPPQELAQLRPLRLAESGGVGSATMIDACLIAASEGVLSLRWDVLCPTCRAPAMTGDQLSLLTAHTHCQACDVDFQSNLASAIELVFRVHPEIRSSDETTYCIGGPEHSPHVVAQLRIEPGESLEIELSLSVGDYLVRGPQLVRTQPLRVVAAAARSGWESVLSCIGAGRHVPTMRRGRQIVTLTNDLEVLHVVRVERTIPRQDVVTAAMASTMPMFRKLFPNQTFADNNPIHCETMAIVAAQVYEVERWYEVLGDEEAYRRIRDQLDRWESIVLSKGGSVVKTIGDQILASFVDRQTAVSAAIQLATSATITIRNERASVAVASGSVLIATQNGRMDLFGGTVRDCLAMLERAGGDVLLDEATATDPVVIRDLGQSMPTTMETMRFPTRVDARIVRLTADQWTAQ